MVFPKNLSERTDIELFKNPTSEYRGLPFWSWNCKLNKETVDEQLEIFKEMGFGGVVIHPREGLDTEYLGDEFMEIVKHTVARCREMGLICWLYDDDRFPSGAADGLVTKNPRFRERQLHLSAKPLVGDYKASEQDFNAAVDAGEIPKGYYCCAYSLDIEDNKLVTYTRIHSEEDIAAAVNSGKKVRFAYLELGEEKEWFQGETYSDTMNPEAVDEFINVTHERYKSVLGDDFGTAASAIFTDEPRLGKQPLLSSGDTEEDAFVPYTEAFAKRFVEKYGIDPLDIIPDYLWERQDGDTHNRYIYHKMTTECFSEAFMDRICEWCKKNGINMTGHILAEEKLGSQTTTVGDAMRTYKNMDIPGIDILIDNRELSTAKQAVSVANQYGREAVMSELYGVTNWDCTFKTYKLQGDWQAALGISIRIPHLSHMSLMGEAKRDWPASIFYQSPWYKEYPYIENYFARLNTVLTRGKRVTRIAVVHPVESMWISYGPEQETLAVRKELEKKFENLAEHLLYSTLDFDYLSEALLSTQHVKCTDEAQLCVGEVVYDTVVISGLKTIRKTTLDILENFAAHGGKIVVMGDAPEMVHGSVSELSGRLMEKCVCIPEDKSTLLEELENVRDISIYKSDGSRSDNLFYHLREDNDCKWLFVCHVNPCRGCEKESYKINIKGEYSLDLYNAMTGETEAVKSSIRDGYTELEWNCYSEESVLFKLGAVSENMAENDEIEHSMVQKLEKIDRFMRSEPNVVLLDFVKYSIDGGEINPREEMLRADNKVRAQLGFSHRTGEDRQPWSTPEGESHDITLYCEFRSEIEVEARLGVENPHKCRISLNGEAVNNAAVGWYVDKAISVVELPAIKKGKNELVIEMEYNQKSWLENMYVLGDFDVRLDGQVPTVTESRKSIHFGDITGQGMPFYTGNLEYIFDTEIHEKGNYSIRLPEFKAPAAAVYVDGEKKGLIAYAPHRLSIGELDEGEHEIRIVMYGNRFNSFGVVHNANENYVWYGNGSYRTEGANWTYDYMLRSAGIMEAVEIEKIVDKGQKM